MRRILYYSLVCLLWVSVNGCKDDEASQPPTPTFSVDRQSGMYNSTTFTFSVDQIGSNAVSLLPYGADHPNDAGILIPASSFTNGKAIVKFTYGKVGTFNAVVVANNHTGDGLSVKNSLSAATAITITSNRALVLDATFDNSTKTVIDTVAKTVVVTVPAGTNNGNITPKITVSDFATVTGPGTNFPTATPVAFSVKSQDGAQTTNWTLLVVVTPREIANNFKSLTGILATKAANKGRLLPADIDSAGNKIVIYDVAVNDTVPVKPADYNAISLDYGLKGTFAKAIYGTYSATGKKVKVKDTVNLASPIKLTVVPQDSASALPGAGPKTFDVYFRVAPRLIVTLESDSISNLYPAVSDTTKDFALNLDVFTKTAVKKVSTTFHFYTPPVQAPAVATIGNIEVIDQSNDQTGPNGSTFVVDYRKPVKVKVQVTEDGITFWATYDVTVTVVK